MLMTGGIASSIPLFKQFPVDVAEGTRCRLRRLAISTACSSPTAQSEFKTLGDFLPAAKASPGKLNIGTISAGGVQNLTANYFKQAADIDVVVVPFKTTPDAIVALMRNDVHMVIDFYAALKGNVPSGKLTRCRLGRTDAVAGHCRSSRPPNRRASKASRPIRGIRST